MKQFNSPDISTHSTPEADQIWMLSISSNTQFTWIFINVGITNDVSSDIDGHLHYVKPWENCSEMSRYQSRCLAPSTFLIWTPLIAVRWEFIDLLHCNLQCYSSSGGTETEYISIKSSWKTEGCKNTTSTSGSSLQLPLTEMVNCVARSVRIWLQLLCLCGQMKRVPRLPPLLVPSCFPQHSQCFLQIRCEINYSWL